MDLRRAFGKGRPRPRILSGAVAGQLDALGVDGAMFAITIGEFTVRCHPEALPAIYDSYVARTRLSEQFEVDDVEGEPCFVGVERGGRDWPFLVIALRSTGSAAGCIPGRSWCRRPSRCSSVRGSGSSRTTYGTAPAVGGPHRRGGPAGRTAEGLLGQRRHAHTQRDGRGVHLPGGARPGPVQRARHLTSVGAAEGAMEAAAAPPHSINALAGQIGR